MHADLNSIARIRKKKKKKEPLSVGVCKEKILVHITQMWNCCHQVLGNNRGKRFAESEVKELRGQGS